jgi:hypothetical protein
MATIRTAYYKALEAERDTLLEKHGFVRVGSEDGYQWESPRLVTAKVYRRIGKLERLMGMVRAGKAWDWLEYSFAYQSRPRGDSIRTLNNWMKGA